MIEPSGRMPQMKEAQDKPQKEYPQAKQKPCSNRGPVKKRYGPELLTHPEKAQHKIRIEGLSYYLPEKPQAQRKKRCGPGIILYLEEAWAQNMRPVGLCLFLITMMTGPQQCPSVHCSDGPTAHCQF